MKTKDKDSKPHFFTIIPHCFYQKLLIPYSFVENWKQEKPDGEAILKSKLGKLWKVKATGRSFEDGWEEFARDHQLHTTDLLVFRHEGGMMFHVMVFDITGCEKKYEQFKDEGRKEKRKRESGEKEENGSKKRVCKDVKRSTATPVVRSIEEPPFFNAKLQPYSFPHSAFMNIQNEFARNNGLTERCCIITLRNKQGSSWPVNLRYKKSDGQVFIGRGWREFSDANRFRIGDVCTFKLVSSGDNVVMEVAISGSSVCEREYAGSLGGNYNNESRNKRVSRDTPLQNGGRIPPVPAKLSEESASFSAKMERYNFKHFYMNIPQDFARSHVSPNQNCMITLRNEEGMSWKVSWCRYRSGRASIRRGWREFSDANVLRMGDACTFKLISTRRNASMEVIISRSIVNERAYQQLQNGRRRSSFADPLQENPRCFIGKVQHCNLSRSYMLIPSWFARSHGLTCRNCKIYLRNEGRSWEVNMRHRTRNQEYIGWGWSKFSNDNKLSMGDTCNFKLISKGKTVVMEVIIYRCAAGEEAYPPFRIGGRRKYKKKCGNKRLSEDSNLLQLYKGAYRQLQNDGGSRSSFPTPVDLDEQPTSFEVEMRRCNFTHGYVTISCKYAQSHGLMYRNCVITLRNEEGRSWEVNMRYKNKNQEYIAGGWPKFSYANKLKVGDICTFKLVSTGKTVVMEVIICRSIAGEEAYPPL